MVIAANKGVKTEIAKQLEAGDEYIELDRQDPAKQWEQLKAANPFGFDVVVRRETSLKSFLLLIHEHSLIGRSNRF